MDKLISNKILTRVGVLINITKRNGDGFLELIKRNLVLF